MGSELGKPAPILPPVAATERWLERAVIGLNLCPFAKAVHAKRQIRYAVSAATTADELRADLREELEFLECGDAEVIDTTMLIHPHALAEFAAYNRFLGDADALVRELGLEGVLQIASFHPDYEFADSPPGAIENYSNRSPYPMLHLLREASIDRAVAAFPDASAIYGKNILTLRGLGHEGWHALWRD
ncbi:MAG: DUF1415 domain-containing protein [Casimicrobiaceae bacterium]